jgi:hypothetical protein
LLHKIGWRIVIVLNFQYLTEVKILSSDAANI